MQRIRHPRPCPECGKILATNRAIARHAAKIHGLAWHDLMPEQQAKRHLAPQIAGIYLAIRTQEGGQ